VVQDWRRLDVVLLLLRPLRLLPPLGELLGPRRLCGRVFSILNLS
jgi:hypothetical protein